MTDMYEKRSSCRLCGSDELEEALSLAPTPISDNYVTEDEVGQEQPYFPLDLLRCTDCANCQLSVVVDPSALYREYLYETQSSLGLVDHFEDYAESVVSSVEPPEKSLVVDIGSNDGSLLRAFEALGHEVLGVDPARELAQRATKQGIETIPEFFDEDLGRRISKDRGQAAIVTANNVIANVDDLAGFVQGVRHLLAPDGVFVFETGYLVDLLENLLFDNVYHEHFSYLAVGPLRRFFREQGLELYDVERVETKGGSIRGKVQLPHGSREKRDRIEMFVHEEDELGLGSDRPYRTLDAYLKETGQKLRSILSEARDEGRQVAGYGASSSVTTMLHEFELAEHIDFLVDDNPRKQGLYSPGHHLPVRSAKALYEEKPIYTVILAWRYADPIIGKHPDYEEEIGRFIVPYPRIELH